MHTQVCVVGTVATDPKLTKSAGRAAFCSFRLACNERRYDAEKQEWIDSATNWYTINSFRDLADHAVASFNKGDRVLVSGRLRVRDWSNGEKSGTSTVVEAEALGHDLRWGTSVFTKLSVAAAPEDSDAAPAASELLPSEPGSMPAWASSVSAEPGEGSEQTENTVDDASNGAEAAAAAFGEDGFTPVSEYSAA